MLPDIDALPKYYKFLKHMKASIEVGDLKPGQKLPSERELSEKHHISRGTVRKALSILNRSGYIVHRQGSGNFVAPSKIKHDSLHLSGFSEDMHQRGMEPGQKILYFGFVEPSQLIKEKLELNEGKDQLLKIVRLRTADDSPMGLQTAYLPFSYDNNFTVDDLLKYGSLYKLLDLEFGTSVGQAFEMLEVSIADDEQAHFLEIPPHSPIFKLERIAWSDSLIPIEYTEMIYRGDRYRYYWHINR